MKTVAFSTVLAEVCQLIGLDRNTLNDKSFNTLRDFTNRRIGTIWDREEWPDIQKFQRTWPGTPILSVSVVPSPLLTESGNELLQEDGDPLWFETAENTVDMTFTLNTFHQRIYLQDFEQPLFQQGTVGDSEVAFANPFYILMDDGSKISLSDRQYLNFTYTTQADDVGDYITSFTITAPWGTPLVQGSFGLQTTAIFAKNKQCVVMIEGQTIGAYSNDPRKTTRAVDQPYIVENFPDLTTSGSILNQERYLLRFSDSEVKYITVRSVAPWLFGSKYDSAISYSAGSQVYYDNLQNSSAYLPVSKAVGSNGNFWICVATASPGVSPQNNSQYWRQVEIPARFKDYLVNGIAADFMRSEGRAEEAAPLDQLAEMAVQQQIDVLIRQQGQIQRLNMAYTY
jgi:hypothetical protein